MQRTNTMSWKKYLLLKLLALVFFNVIVMLVLVQTITDPVWLYFANVINIVVLVVVTGLLKKKRGEAIVNEPRDITRMVLKVFLKAGMPFLIALLALLIGRDPFIVMIDGEPYIPVMPLIMQLVLYGFAYGMMFAVVYALTTD